MKSIHCDLVKFNEAKLADVLNCYSVYIIWDSQSQKRATYIGFSENVATRLGDHTKKWLAKPINGYIAFFKDKEEALLVEALLIDIGLDTDRLQDHNEMSGHMKYLEKFYNLHGKIKIYINNFDPFSVPLKSRKLESPKMINIVSNNEYYDDFRTRRKC